MYDMELDTLDIVVSVAAIVAGFSLLTMTGWWDFEEEVICLTLAATLGLKRLFIPTPSKMEERWRPKPPRVYVKSRLGPSEHLKTPAWRPGRLLVVLILLSARAPGMEE